MAVTNARISVDQNASDSLQLGATKINGNFDVIDTELERINGEVTKLNARTTRDQANLLGLAIELETLKGAILNNVSANIYVETFNNLDDTTLTNGVYDSVARKIVLK